MDVGHRDPLGGERQQLLQQRLAVAIEPAARRASTSNASGSAWTPSAWTICRSRSKIDRVEMPAKSKRWQRERIVIGIFVGFGGAEDELHVLGRLLQVFNRALNASRVSMCTSSIM